jgi:hypothetical protein
MSLVCFKKYNSHYSPVIGTTRRDNFTDSVTLISPKTRSVTSFLVQRVSLLGDAPNAPPNKAQPTSLIKKAKAQMHGTSGMEWAGHTQNLQTKTYEMLR